MPKDDDILNKLSEERQQAAKKNMPTGQAKKDLDDLLHFGTFSRGETTKESRLEIRAVLMSAVTDGMSLDEARSLKQTLLNSPPEQTSELLKDLNKSNDLSNVAIPKIQLERQTGVKLEPTELEDIDQVEVKPPVTINVSEETGQNLEVANSVNFAVKSIITDGAPNQAPDLFRTNGKNVLHYNSSSLGNDVGKIIEKDPVHSRDIDRAAKIDLKRGKLSQPFGESYAGVYAMAQKTAAFGTGKCGEHAATTFSILSDPASLAKLGVKIPEGSMIILAKGEKIDHSYVLIAEPGSVDFVGGVNDPARKVNVKDPSKVVVVDPWMPVPTAHTLDRANGEIQVDPEAKLVVTMKKGEPHLLERNNKLTKLPPGEGSVLEKLQDIQEKYHPEMLSKAQESKVTPDDTDESLVQACGQLEEAHIGYTPKPLPYHKCFVSTDTPQDQYQRVNKKGEKVGEPKSYFVGDQKYLANENEFLKKAKETPDILSISRNPANQKLLTEGQRSTLEIWRNHKGVKVEPEGIKPEVEELVLPRKNSVGDDLRASKNSGLKPEKLDIELEPQKLDKIGTPKVGKLRNNPQMAEYMSQFEKVEETPQLNVKPKVQKLK